MISIPYIALPLLAVSAMYRTIFNPKIFTDITMPVKQSYSPNTGKVSVLLMI